MPYYGKPQYGQYITLNLYDNKANLRDLIPVTLFGQRDFQIAWMTMKNNHLQMIKSDPYLKFLGLCNLEIWRMKIQEELHSGEQ